MELHHAYEARFCISVLETWTMDHEGFMRWDGTSPAPCL